MSHGMPGGMLSTHDVRALAHRGDGAPQETCVAHPRRLRHHVRRPVPRTHISHPTSWFKPRATMPDLRVRRAVTQPACEATDHLGLTARWRATTSMSEASTTVGSITLQRRSDSQGDLTKTPTT